MPLAKLSRFFSVEFTAQRKGPPFEWILRGRNQKTFAEGHDAKTIDEMKHQVANAWTLVYVSQVIDSALFLDGQYARAAKMEDEPFDAGA